MAIDANEQIEKFHEFIEINYQKQLNESIRTGKKYLLIDFHEVAQFDPILSEELLEQPEETLKAAELSLEQFNLPEGSNIRIRFNNLPKSQEILIRDLRSMNLGKLLFLTGIVRQSSDVRPQVVSAKFECPACGNTIAILQLDTKFKEPTRCSCGRRGHFRLLSKDLVDAQRLVIEESPESLTGGEQPKRISIFLKEDLVEPKMEKRTTPGSKVRITGIVKEVPITLKSGVQSIRYDLMVEANYIEPIEESYEEIEISEKDKEEIFTLSKDPRVYERLIKSIAPSIFGHEDIKEALILQLMGGVRKQKNDGTVIRGDMHILLVGDPGSSKSTLLMYMSKAAPKARYISGKGASGAGLTASVVKDEFLRGWALEAGALVLANGGLACLHPETDVFFNNKLIKIKNLFKKPDIKIGGIELQKINGIVPSLEFTNLKIANIASTKIRRKYYKGKLCNLQFESGSSIKLTPDHLLIDGSTLKWKAADQFSNLDSVISPLKIPQSSQKNIYLLDIIPNSWKISLTKNEKNELKESILKKFKTLTEANKFFELNRHYLSGGKQLTASKFKKIIGHLKEYNKWRNKNLIYTRKSSGNKFNVNKITPEIGYILGFICGEGYVKITNRRTAIQITQALKHKEFINKLNEYYKKITGKKFGVYKRLTIAKIKNKKVISENAILHTGNDLLGYLYKKYAGNSLKEMFSLPNEVIKAFIAGLMDSDGCISTKTSKGYKSQHIEFLISNNKKFNLNFILLIRKLDCYAKLIEGKNISIIRITGRKDVSSLQNQLKDYSIKIKKSKLLIRKTNISSISDKLPSKPVSEICKKISNLNKSLLIKKGIWSTIYDYKTQKRIPSRDQLIKIKDRIGKYLNNETLYSINTLLHRDFFLDKIKKIDQESYEGYVYDLFIPKKHNFIANGIFVHNCIDELDKMSAEDRSAMHEALEQQRVTISKANIQATLKAETTVLAAANPKLGRFDPYSPIAGQIELPSTLINRFDLIFPIRDIPSKELDEKIASHVLSLQQNPDLIKPEVPIDLFKKYIAYAKQNIKPKLTDGALEAIKKFYVNLRNATSTISSGEEALKPIPISARQLEALVRLAEGSARVRLSKTVTKRDAQRAINLLRSCLMQVGFDYETGQIDIDRISTGIPTSERSKIITVRSIINDMQSKGRKTILIEDLISEASEKDISESEVEDIIEKLKREGTIFEPRRGHISLI